jgi:alginate O-acetyltransferase complex protein AlgI
MVFNSLTFVVFFAVVLLLHNLPLGWGVKKFNLLIGSYIFYAAWNPPFILLLWCSTLVDWLVARQMSRQPTQALKRRWLVISLVVNLGFLGFFKYGNFALTNWQALMAAIGVHYTRPAWNILLPVGISFYTFHSMSYTLDIYFGRVKPIPKLFDFALFVAFFTQLVAGPILRTSQLVPQFETPRRASSDQQLWGLALMCLGLFEKVVLADGALAPTADAVFGATDPLGFVDAWVGTLAFAGQIFCDFAGYSTIAIGAALCLGFSIPSNFNYPYAAIGFQDFWRRWHISLSTWLRDYLYIPLGGNRKGKGRTYLNILITMLLGGLWHGANWTFVAWGGLHAIYLCVERWLREHGVGSRFAGLPTVRFVLGILTFLAICVTWVFFRAHTFAAAGQLLAAMIGLHPKAPALLSTIFLIQVPVVVLGILATHWLMRDRKLEDVVARAPWPLVAGAWAAVLALVIFTQGNGDAFIYFQF